VDEMGRVLALDPGTARIGVAVSDPLGITAQPHSVLTAGPALLKRIEELAVQLDVRQIVVGLPVNLDGSEGPAARHAREFADRVRSATGLPTDLVDERFSTVIAERAMIEGRVRRSRRRHSRDGVAAAVFLQSYLDGT
jgi:putative Holliday junction resolvase